MREVDVNLDVQRQAEQFLDLAWDAARPVDQRKFARKALSLDLDCIDAYVVLAISSRSLAEKIALLKEAVSVGERIWAEELLDDDFPWWGILETRPFMRAMHNLGLELENAGRNSEAENIYQCMLDMNPNDNAGVRYLLLRLWTAQGELKSCELLLENYPEDYGLEAMMTALLIRLSKNSPIGVAEALAELVERNEYVLPMLKTALGKNRWPKTHSDMIAVGSKDEAKMYLHDYQDGWLLSEKAGKAFLRAYDEWSNNH